MMNSVIKTHIGLFRFIFYLMSILIHYSKKVSISLHFFFNKFIYLLIYFWLPWVFVAVCGLFSSCSEQGLLFVAMRGLLIAVASLVAEHRF